MSAENMQAVYERLAAAADVTEWCKTERYYSSPRASARPYQYTYVPCALNLRSLAPRWSTSQNGESCRLLATA